MTLPLRIILTGLMVCSFSGLMADDLFVNPSAQTAVTPESKPSPKPIIAAETSTDAQQLQEVIENQLAAIRSFDVSRAYYAYTTKEFQKTVSLETFKQFVKKYAVLFRNKHAAQEQVSFNGNQANYKGKLVSVDGEVYSVDVVLYYTDDEWKIHSLSLFPQHNRRLPLR